MCFIVFSTIGACHVHVMNPMLLSESHSSSSSSPLSMSSVSCLAFIRAGQEHSPFGGFYKRGYPKWLVDNGNPIKMDDLGLSIFQETTILQTKPPYRGNPAIYDYWRLWMQTLTDSPLLGVPQICVGSAECPPRKRAKSMSPFYFPLLIDWPVTISRVIPT